MRTKKTKEEIQAAARARQARFFAGVVRINVSIPLDLIEKLDRACEAKQKRRTELIRWLIEQMPD